jgi:dsDNA-specific endonuclease/ATPase MutS2
MTQRKEYEMSDGYKRSTQNLLNAIELREKLVGMLKTARPAKRAKIVESIAQLERQIDKHEQTLANEYELTQKLGQAEEAYEAQLTELDEMSDNILADMKEKAPELYRKLKAELDEIDNREDE